MSMINKQEFKALQDQFEEFDHQREALIKLSRGVVKASKKVIYAVHRNELHKAKKLKEAMKKDLKKLITQTKKHNALYYSGFTRIAEQEYVEAVSFYEFMANKNIPSAKDLGVDQENYLLGLCDLTGELTRKAINASIKENYEITKEIWEFLEALYGELMMFDFRNNELRRKFDGVKYSLQKVENVVLELKLKKSI